jgi:aminoglycoside phosphotransferase family enzyme
MGPTTASVPSGVRGVLAPDPTLAEKVAYLSRPESYGKGVSAVEVIETHMSYVFLVDRFVYKLKKPVRYPFLDFSTLEARRFNCDEELRLNRRLARTVYLAVVALTFFRSGLRLEGTGEPVEWLVKMRRLPRHLMLDRAIQERRVGEQDIVRLTHVLAGFYATADRVALTRAEYRERLRCAIQENHRYLARAIYGMDPALLGAIRDRQLEFVEHQSSVLDARVDANQMVEGHGDLRPEHVCLAAEPIIIDCLEFNRDLRIADPADELAYLAMECEFAGAGEIRHTLLATYRSITADSVPEALIEFYQAYRAVLRARLAAFHLEDHLTEAERMKWLARGRAYLQLAQGHLARIA